MDSFIFLDITPSSPLKAIRRFGKLYRLSLFSALWLFSLDLFLDLEDEGDMSPRNVCCLSTEYTSLYYIIYTAYIRNYRCESLK
jgi:hypothetical protein